MYNAIICFLVEWCKLFANIAYKQFYVCFDSIRFALQNQSEPYISPITLKFAHPFSTSTAVCCGASVSVCRSRVENRIQIKIEFV